MAKRHSGGSFQLGVCRAWGGGGSHTGTPLNPEAQEHHQDPTKPPLNSHLRFGASGCPGTPMTAPQEQPPHPPSPSAPQQRGSFAVLPLQSTSTQIWGPAEVHRDRRWGRPHPDSQSTWLPRSTFGFTLQEKLRCKKPLNLYETHGLPQDIHPCVHPSVPHLNHHSGAANQRCDTPGRTRRSTKAAVEGAAATARPVSGNDTPDLLKLKKK